MAPFSAGREGNDDDDDKILVRFFFLKRSPSTKRSEQRKLYNIGQTTKLPETVLSS